MPTERFAARIANLSDSKIIVEQTQYSEKSQRYVISYNGKDKIERHVDLSDDAAIGAAIRLAMKGKLTKN